MSSDVSAPVSEVVPQQWPELDQYERRVLGVLIEKQKTTPDAYPLSMNGLITGCNQKSNREPIMNLEELDVESTLNSLKEKGLIIRVQGVGRVERWRHNVYDLWQVDKVELAVLADLLLRGEQTEGELRSHVNRMEPVEDLEALRSILNKLAERKLVIYLTPPGHRGTKVTHGFHATGELEALRQSARTEAGAGTVPMRTAAAPINTGKLAELEQALGQAQAEIGELRSQVSDLQGAIAALRQELQGLKQALGA